MTGMLLGYARVSTDQQDHALQLDALRGAGCERVFVETASGTRADRPELARLLETARPGDQICVWRLDRLARSLRHLIDIADDLQRRGIALRSLTESIDTSTPSGRFLFNILGALGQMEREIIVERTKAGLRASRLRGRVGGRPRALDQTKLTIAQTLMGNGNLSMAEIARQVGCAPSTLYRSLPGGRRGSTTMAATA
ncbi:invertase [Siccirubricoccus deserti]|nr:invertase [Siccirubricoccus deserti]